MKVEAELSDKLSDDRGNHQRTTADVDGRLKLFMHLPEQVGGCVSLPDKKAVKLARGTGARLYDSPHLRDKSVGLQSQPPSFVDEDDPLATVAVAWMMAVRA